VYAYEKQHNAKPPSTNNVPSAEFSSTDYGKIWLDDNDRKTSETDTNNYYAIHRFNFTITEPTARIDKIKVTWNGKGYHDYVAYADGANLSIWNFASGAYELLQASANTDDEVTLAGEKTSSISNYISPSENVTVLVEQKSAHSADGSSHIETDYVQLRVEWS
jgi:hypothetical protein